MKMKKLLSVIVSSVMVITSLSLTAFLTSADDSLNYNSTITTNIRFEFLDADAEKNYYFVIDNYKDYTDCGLKEKSQEFFNDNMLLVNYIFNDMCACDVYTNKSVVKSSDNTLSISYSALWEYPRSFTVEYVTDIIELKKADVKNVDFSRLSVGVKNEYITSDPAFEPTPSSKYVELEMNYIDISSVLANNTSNNKFTQAQTTSKFKVITPTSTTTVTKPAKVTNVKLKAKKKKLNVSWKKVNGATGYEVVSATNNKFTKNKETVKVKKNGVTLKKLKSKKKCFVKVRAYKLANGNKYFGKWSKVVKKKAK